MARIDRFAGLLAGGGGGRLILVSGARAILDLDGQARAVTSSRLGRKLLEEMIDEIAPPGLAGEIAEEGEHRFRYASPHGAVSVGVRRGPDRLRIELEAGEDVASGGDAAASSADATASSDDPTASGGDAAASSGAAPASNVSGRSSAPAASGDGPTAGGDGELTMDELFRLMVERGCSDLHLSSNGPPLFRKDGKLVDLTRSGPLSPDAVRSLLMSITPPERRAEFEDCGDADFAYEIRDTGRFRCNLFLDRRGPGGVFRVIPIEILTTEELGLARHIVDLCRLSKGLVLVTGPTGSGKSTTLAAMLDWINRHRTDHIITIEDPIEFVHDNKQCLINQREVGGHTRGFKSALRAALREDPDIVLVGEMRDLETVEIAIETAETGHLVFGTLHTNTAPSTVDRIIDQFPTERQAQIRMMLSESLKGVIAQTLCRKKGGGRVAALEVLIVNHAVSNLIREGKTFQIPSIMQTGRKQGMTTLNDALLQLVADGVVEPEEARSKAVQRSELVELLRARGFAVADDAKDPG